MKKNVEKFSLSGSMRLKMLQLLLLFFILPEIGQSQVDIHPGHRIDAAGEVVKDTTDAVNNILDLEGGIRLENINSPYESENFIHSYAQILGTLPHNHIVFLTDHCQFAVPHSFPRVPRRFQHSGLGDPSIINPTIEVNGKEKFNQTYYDLLRREIAAIYGIEVDIKNSKPDLVRFDLEKMSGDTTRSFEGMTFFDYMWGNAQKPVNDSLQIDRLSFVENHTPPELNNVLAYLFALESAYVDTAYVGYTKAFSYPQITPARAKDVEIKTGIPFDYNQANDLVQMMPPVAADFKRFFGECFENPNLKIVRDKIRDRFNLSESETDYIFKNQIVIPLTTQQWHGGESGVKKWFIPWIRDNMDDVLQDMDVNALYTPNGLELYWQIMKKFRASGERPKWFAKYSMMYFPKILVLSRLINEHRLMLAEEEERRQFKELFRRERAEPVKIMRRKILKVQPMFNKTNQPDSLLRRNQHR